MIQLGIDVFVILKEPIKKKEDIIHFQYIVILAPLNGLKPCLRDHEFHMLRRELRGHQNHKSSFSQLCIGVKKI